MDSTLLVIDDDPEIALALQATADELHFRLVAVSDGVTGLARAQEQQDGVVVLDLGLPGMSGMEVCRQLRATHPKLPILVVTSRDDEISTVLALELGADDYVAKPFRIAEVTARIRAILRRTNAQQATTAASSKLMAGDIVLDPASREVTKRGTPVELTRVEFDLLWYLMANVGTSFTRADLTDQVWGYRCSSFDGTVTAYLSRLRSKIEEDAANPRYLLTVRGFGYRFVAPNTDGA